ncbi:hypothetical protein [Dokdonella sp.]|uniref:hypothetical protein n=1 Tax=Dokdonella sp. TaxID=2291710 RepID=UPI001B2E11BF|nr:hypothetical protein [Dokdonella sp.]MBO9664877.1 hypothetical protein [Dokdonella sp.]
MTSRNACFALFVSLASLASLSSAATFASPPDSPLSAEDAVASRENIRQNYIGDPDVPPTLTGENPALDSPLIPFAWNEQAIRVTDGTGFGGSIAVSGDIAFVSAATTNGNQGAVYVYQRSNICSMQGCPWVQKQRLVASDGAPNTYFGKVAFDGTTALIGASSTTVDGRPSQGAVYVFSRGENRNFAQVQKLTAPDGAASDCYFGTSVAIAGSDALIGAPGCGGTNQAINSRGSAYRYRKDANGNWVIVQKFVASDGGFAESFGRAVAINADTAVIGADSAFQFGYYGVGAAYVYRKQCFPDGRCNPNWLEKQKLIASPTSTGMEFGSSIVLSGTDLFIGAPWALTGDENLPIQPISGAVWAFKQIDGQWVQQQEMIPSDAYHDWLFGISISRSKDTLVVGSAFAGWPNMKGAAYVFVLNNGIWTEVQKLTASDGTLNDSFGSGVGISDSGDVLVGSPQGLNNSGQGTMYVYTQQ